MPWISETGRLTRPRILELVDETIEAARRQLGDDCRRVLLLPPDITRMHSGAGWITEAFYQRLSEAGADVHVIPTLGQHEPHTPAQNRTMFGTIPESRIHAHDWRSNISQVGTIDAATVEQVCEGRADWELPIWLNDAIAKEKWDWIINVGHVVPHEVLGFANHNKNYFIGLGGRETICASHLAAALCGIENNLGTLVTPVRQLFNLAEERFLSHLPDLYVQLVMARDASGRLIHTGYHAGDDLETYLQAARQSARENITILDQPLKSVVCLMQGDEFFSTWVANKAVYRTRMAIADGGELLILAPGLRRFGEQPEVERIIRQYGYRGTPGTLQAYREDAFLQEFAHAAAHLIHGSSEGRFTIRYAPGHLEREEIESIGYEYADLAEMLEKYPIDELREGCQTVDGEEFFFVPTPSIGLWATEEKLGDRLAFLNAQTHGPDQA